MCIRDSCCSVLFCLIVICYFMLWAVVSAVAAFLIPGTHVFIVHTVFLYSLTVCVSKINWNWSTFLFSLDCSLVTKWQRDVDLLWLNERQGGCTTSDSRSGVHPSDAARHRGRKRKGRLQTCGCRPIDTVVGSRTDRQTDGGYWSHGTGVYTTRCVTLVWLQAGVRACSL